jgi:hypothetical protein
LPPVAAGIVIPGVHVAAPVGVLQVAPMLPPEPPQFAPLQQTLGPCDWGVHARPGAQPPVESQRQPWLPTRHVDGTVPDVPAPELVDPEEAPELAPELPPELPPEPPPELPFAPAPPSDASPPWLPPHAAATTAKGSQPMSARCRDAFIIVSSFGSKRSRGVGPSAPRFGAVGLGNQRGGGAHTSAPPSRTHAEVAPQQSDEAVHGAPLSEQAAAHWSVPSLALQRPPQQSLASTHPTPAPPHEASGASSTQRLGVPFPAIAQRSPAQQLAGPAQISPTAPQPPAG